MNIFKKLKKIITPQFGTTVLIVILSCLLLGLFVKGNKGTPIYYQTEKDRSLGGPFEAPNSTSRYSLTEALADRGTVLLTKEQAEFSQPDVVSYQGKYFTVFMPGISFIGVPFYLLGKQIGLQQLFSYLSVTIFAFLNMFLIARIAYRLGANLYASLLAGFIFLFATSELSYAVVYTQHATSITFLLLSTLLVMGKRSVLKNILFGVCAGISLLLDVPNIILLFPAGLYLLTTHIGVHKTHTATKFSLNSKLFALLLGIIPFVILIASYNMQITGSYTKIAQSVGAAGAFVAEGQQPSPSSEPSGNPQVIPFTPKVQILGFYTLLFSNERSWLFYSPVVWLGVLGFIKLYRKKETVGFANILAGTMLLNIILYSMFEDPWGGWAFGPRYLIPAAAMLCVGLGVAISAYNRRFWFVLLFGLTAFYSLFINTIGALTTTLVPFKASVLDLHLNTPYTYIYNIQLVNEGKLGSLAYNLLFSTLPAWVFVLTVGMILICTAGCLFILSCRFRKTYKEVA